MVDALWARAQDALRAELSAKDFESWIKPLRPREWAACRFVLEVPSAFARDWLNRHLHDSVRQAVSSASGEPASVVFEVNDALKPVRGRRSAAKRLPAVESSVAAPRYTFDSFVIGMSNEVAVRACLSVAEAPGIRFNPVVIHGGVGLGKTHLLSATSVAVERSGASVRLVTAEGFVNELVHAMRNDGMGRFRDRYRGLDMLIVDDVQFLAGKRKSQEEFVHTFNALLDLGKQIVLASDRPPDELTEMSSALRNRLASGLLAAIQAPDEAMRAELVRRKLAERRLELPVGVESLLVAEPWQSIRALEGAVARLEAASTLQGKTIAEDDVARILGWASQRRGQRLGVRGIMEAVSKEFDVSVDLLASRSRSAKVALARQLVFRLSRNLTDMSLKAIGEQVGRRDHSTVVHGIDRAEERLAADPGLRARFERLQTGLSRCGGVEWAVAMDGTDGARGSRHGAAGTGTVRVVKPRARRRGTSAVR